MKGHLSEMKRGTYQNDEKWHLCKWKRDKGNGALIEGKEAPIRFSCIGDFTKGEIGIYEKGKGHDLINI